MSAQSPLHSITVAPPPIDVALAAGAEDDGDLPRRQCGRCRLMFPGDPELVPGTIPDWWVCTPCRSALFGDAPKTRSDRR